MDISINYTKNVRYELMHGREATQRIKEFPVGYLPTGCLERHGDHLPMGLDVIKAHGICCLIAQAIGGVVFPAHFYSGIHGLDSKTLQRFTGQWGNLYTDETAKQHLKDIINQFIMMGIKVLVLYSGHYPKIQCDMVKEIAEEYNANGHIRIIPATEPDILDEGDHAGICETSFMLYLDKNLVDMNRISQLNYQDHGWSDKNSPELASAAKGEVDVQRLIKYFGENINDCLKSMNLE